MNELMRGQATSAQTAAYLTALSLDKVTPEIVAASAEVSNHTHIPSYALPPLQTVFSWFPFPFFFFFFFFFFLAPQTMRSHALPCDPNCDVIDVVGTGGDGIDTFNVSTAASIIVAAAGGKVLKHGNRSNSSKCGSADILEQLGANLQVDGKAAVAVMQQCGFCFLFAQKFHPAMRFVGPVRRELAVRTLFNILGPLTNPAKAKYYVTGVFHSSLGRLFAETFIQMGIKRSMVVHSHEGSFFFFLLIF